MPTGDERKRQSNIENPELDFQGCEAVFDGRVLAWDDDREAYANYALIDWAGYTGPLCI